MEIQSSQVHSILADKRNDVNNQISDVITNYRMGLITFREHLGQLGDIANQYDFFLIKTINSLKESEGECDAYWMGFINALEVV